jgi:uncharacterized membrane protein
MEKSLKAATLAAVAGAFVAVVAMGVAPAAQAADESEKCFGISKAGENDCAVAGRNGCAGQSKVDFDGKDWKAVKTGTCTGIEVEAKNTDGTMAKRKGSLTEVTS